MAHERCNIIGFILNIRNNGLFSNEKIDKFIEDKRKNNKK